MTTDMLDQGWSPSGQAAASRVGEEIVLLHLGSGTYFGLDPLGAKVWQGLLAKRTPAELCAAIAEEYDEDAERVRADVRAFLLHLSEHGLIGRC